MELVRFVPHIIDRSTTLEDFCMVAGMGVYPPKDYQQLYKHINRQNVTKILKDFIGLVENDFNSLIENLKARYPQYSRNEIIRVVRISITGKQVSLPLSVMMSVLSKQEIIERVKKAVEEAEKEVENV